eukprot:11909711-Heterocapsa_arctica.AAC.1
MIQRLALIVGKVKSHVFAICHLLVQDLTELILRELGAHLGTDEPPAPDEVGDTVISTPGEPRQVLHPE